MPHFSANGCFFFGKKLAKLFLPTFLKNFCKQNKSFKVFFVPSLLQRLENHMKISKISKPFYTTCLFLYPPENIRKPLDFLCFQGVKREDSGMKQVKLLQGNVNFVPSKSRVENYLRNLYLPVLITQLKFTCSKLPIETLEKGEKYVHKVNKEKNRTTSMTSFWCFYC